MKISCGYYVNTKNVFPFRGCGWYSEALVTIGLKDKLITHEDIEYEFLPSKKLPAEPKLQALESKPKLQKFGVNALNGCIGKSSNIIS